MSYSDFGDDDEETLQLLRMTHNPPNPAQNGHLDASLADLFRAQGEIAILRAQLESLEQLKVAEAARLNGQLGSVRDEAKDQIEAFKLTVEKLEDEKRFLRNEVKLLSATKRRKVSQEDSSDSVLVGAEKMLEASATIKFGEVQVHDDWLQLCHHLWHYTISGADRTVMKMLGRVCLSKPLCVGPDFHVAANAPVLGQLWDYFLNLRMLRLDVAVQTFSVLVFAFVHRLLEAYHGGRSELLLSVPFLLSLVYAAATFKLLAITELLATRLIVDVCKVVEKFVFVLQLNDEEEEALMGHENVTYQQRLLENFTLVVGLDLLELLALVLTQYGPEAVRNHWLKHVFDRKLFQAILPESTERLVSMFQINVAFNVVEILSASLTETGFADGSDEHNRILVKSLIKAFLMDIDIKDDFIFYGLNRCLGNNNDWSALSAVIPEEFPPFLNGALTAVPCPVRPQKRGEKELSRIRLEHDCHLLSLRMRIATLLESMIVAGMSNIVNLRENIKLIVRVLGFEQNLIMQQPRYQFVHMRILIIAVLVQVLYYIIDEHKNVNTLIYPETLYELLVVLMRIAFDADSLSSDAHALLAEVRSRGAVDLAVFNAACELRSRELAHLPVHRSATAQDPQLADIESSFPNGLEFPYDSETIEIAREILGVCLNHDEADNLYYNMYSLSV